MRNILLCATFMLLSLVAHAQQALWGSPSLLSPEIHPDNTVTFRYRAPKAVRVQVTGDFLPQGQVAELTEVDGIWQYTTPQALQPELYSYSFIVDGVKAYDPNNVYLIRDVATVTNVFLISGDRASLYAINDVPHGTVSKVWYNSETLGLQRRLSIYTPAGYETSNKRYPVFYLLHGMGGDENAWLELGRTSQILDNLIAQGKAEPMIVVMPYANPYPEMMLRGITDRYDSMDTKLTTEEFTKSVVPFIEANYNVLTDAQNRAIAGFSLGGRQTLACGLGNPDMFSYVCAFAPAIFGPEISSNFENGTYASAAELNEKMNLVWLSCGTSDFLYQSSLQLEKNFKDRGIEHKTMYPGGGHTWMNCRDYITAVAQLLFKK